MKIIETKVFILLCLLKFTFIFIKRYCFEFVGVALELIKTKKQ